MSGKAERARPKGQARRASQKPEAEREGDRGRQTSRRQLTQPDNRGGGMMVWWYEVHELVVVVW